MFPFNWTDVCLENKLHRFTMCTRIVYVKFSHYGLVTSHIAIVEKDLEFTAILHTFHCSMYFPMLKVPFSCTY